MGRTSSRETDQLQSNTWAGSEVSQTQLGRKVQNGSGVLKNCCSGSGQNTAARIRTRSQQNSSTCLQMVLVLNPYQRFCQADHLDLNQNSVWSLLQLFRTTLDRVRTSLSLSPSFSRPAPSPSCACVLPSHPPVSVLFWIGSVTRIITVGEFRLKSRFWFRVSSAPSVRRSGSSGRLVLIVWAGLRGPAAGLGTADLHLIRFLCQGSAPTDAPHFRSAFRIRAVRLDR